MKLQTAAETGSPNTMQDVVITGLGLLTPMGRSLREVRESFTAARPLTRVMAGTADRARAGAQLRTQHGAPALQPDALAPAMAAWADAGLEAGALSPERLGVYLGAGAGLCGPATSAGANALAHVAGRGAAERIAASLGLHGACETFVSGSGSSAVALTEALKAIRHGYLDAAIVGGMDAPLVEGTYRAWEAAGVLAPVQGDPVCRPFDRERNGTLLGEGTVLCVLESAAHARGRGARIHARLAGFGHVTDVTRTGPPDACSRALAIQRCLQDARLATDQIGYISADAWGDRQSDASEVDALRQVFGSRLPQVPLSATKSIHGHMAAASAAAGLLPALLALGDGLIAPTPTLDEVDPDFADLSLPAACQLARFPLQAALVNSFALDGANSCLALTRH